MTFKWELCQSEFSVLSSRFIKNLFPLHIVDKIIIQQRLMFCFKFSFTIFLLIFFPLCSKFFINILKIYDLPKINNTIPKYCQTHVLTIIIYQANSMSQLQLVSSELYPINFTENVALGEKDSFGPKLKKVLGRIFF